MEANIYIETSIPWNKSEDGIVGIAVSIDEPEEARSYFGIVRGCSESAAVLFGLKNALRYLDGFEVIQLNISCASVAAAFDNGWIQKWQDQDFYNSKGQPIKNREIWMEVVESLRGRAVEVKLNEFNGFRRWLKAECMRRVQKYG